MTRQQVVSLTQSSCLSTVMLTEGKWVGGGEPNHMAAYPAINNSIFWAQHSNASSIFTGPEASMPFSACLLCCCISIDLCQIYCACALLPEIQGIKRPTTIVTVHAMLVVGATGWFETSVRTVERMEKANSILQSSYLGPDLPQPPQLKTRVR